MHTFKAQNQIHHQQSLNAITSVHTMKCLQHAIQFMHVTLSPTKAKLLMATKAGFLSSWPLLTTTNVSKFLTKMPATHKEYLHCIHQNIQSTKPSPPQVEDAILNEAKTHLVYSVILDTTHKQGWGYYDSLSNFKGLQQLEDICGIKHPRVGDSNKPYHPKSDVSPHRETKHHCNQLPLHQYPTRNKLLNTLHTTNCNYLLVYLMDAIDPTNHTKVSTAYINAIICPTTGRKQEF